MPINRHSFAFLILACPLCASAVAHKPVGFLEVLQVQPSALIEHEVDTKGPFDRQRIEIDLAGPRFFSRSVAAMDRPVGKAKAYLNWFEIVGAEEQPKREVSVLDMVRGSENLKLTVATPKYLLSPAQLITTGTPDPVPHGLDHYLAYEVIDGKSMQMELKVTDSTGSRRRRVGKPLFFCARPNNGIMRITSPLHTLKTASWSTSSIRKRTRRS